MDELALLKPFALAFAGALLFASPAALAKESAGGKKRPIEVIVQTAPTGADVIEGGFEMTPDGKYLVFGGTQVRMFELATGLLIRNFPLSLAFGQKLLGYRGGVSGLSTRHIAISDDGAFVAASINQGSGDPQIQIWKAATGEAINLRWSASTEAHGIRFTSDGKLLIFGSKPGPKGKWMEMPPTLLDPLTGKELGRAPFLPTEWVATAPGGVAWLQNDEWNYLKAADARTGKELRRVPAIKYSRAAFSPDRKRLVVTGEGYSTLNVFDTASGRLLFTGTMPPKPALAALGFKDDGKTLLAVVCYDSSTAVEFLYSWAIDANGPPVKVELPRDASSNYAQALSPDGRVFVVSKTAVRFFDTTTWQQINGETVASPSISMPAFTSDGEHLFANEYTQRREPFLTAPVGHRSTLAWDLAAGRLGRRLESRELIHSPDGKRAVLLAGKPALLDAATLNPLAEIPLTVSRPDSESLAGASGARFSDDGKRFAIWSLRFLDGHDVGELVIGDGPSGTVIKSLPGTGAAFSADGRRIAVIAMSGPFNNYRYAIHVYDADKVEQLAEFPVIGAISVATSPDGAVVAVGGRKDYLGTMNGAAALYNASTGKLIAELPVEGSYPVHGLAFSPDGSQLFTCGDSIQVWESRTGKAVRRIETEYPTNGIAFRPGHPEQLAVATQGGELDLLRVDGAPIARLFAFGAADYLALLPDNRYAASRGALSNVAFRAGVRVFPFDQFDLRFNRPDAVLRALGAASQARIDAARVAVARRLKRMGFTEEQLAGELQLPEIQLHTPAPSTKERNLELAVQIKPAGAALDRLLVTDNDVPIAGSAGLSLKGSKDKEQRELVQTISVPLSIGKNRIEISALDVGGAESLRRRFEVIFDAPPKKPDLYLVAVGVSQYKDAQRSLTYAAKDAGDLATFFEQKRDQFGAVNVLRILDGDATREKIAAARELLGKSTVDDEAIVFFAGHGVRDAKLDYYFGTTDLDFDNPAERGLPYEDIEGLLDGIGARKKLLLIDSCNSGELDKDESTLVASNDTKTPDGIVKSRGFSVVKSKTPAIGADVSTTLLEEMFADLRRGSGAVAIASAGGAQYALESDAWKNGVFTYALLSTMGTGKSRVSEVRDQVTAKVMELTQGQQRPTVRRENLSNDFAIY